MGWLLAVVGAKGADQGDRGRWLGQAVMVFVTGFPPYFECSLWYGDVSIFWAALRLLLVGMRPFFFVQLLIDRVIAVLWVALHRGLVFLVVIGAPLRCMASACRSGTRSRWGIGKWLAVVGARGVDSIFIHTYHHIHMYVLCSVL